MVISKLIPAGLFSAIYRDGQEVDVHFLGMSYDWHTVSYGLALYLQCDKHDDTAFCLIFFYM